MGEKKTQWLEDLAQSFNSPQALLEFLSLDPRFFVEDINASSLFAFRVPRSFAHKMQKGNPHDPLLLQVLTSRNEFIEVQGFSTDPLHEQTNPAPNILHKYHNRLLFMINPSCAINCRYCFRRHFPYHEVKSSKRIWQQSLSYIKEHPEINEVILSGGDPLMVQDHRLASLIKALEEIEHLNTLRIHTRLPVVIEERITDNLCTLLSNSSLQTVMVLHINHPQEIGDLLGQKMQRLRQAKVVLLNQAVLLKNINDDPMILKELSDKLFSVGILPYYLHLLDKVSGASHFLVDDSTALAIYRQLQSLTSGYLVPKLTREIAGEKHKTIIS